MKNFILFLLATIIVVAIGGCGTVIRVSNLPEKMVATDTDTEDGTVTVTTKKNGVVVEEVTTTVKNKRERIQSRPYYYDGYDDPYRGRYRQPYRLYYR